MQKQSIGISQILSSSGSSFFSSGSCSFQNTMATHEQIYESFLLFIQSASSQMCDDLKDINVDCQNLLQILQQIKNNKSSEPQILSTLDKIYENVSLILISQIQNESKKLSKCDSTLTNETITSMEKQSLPSITTIISKIVFKLFTGSNKQKYAHIILNMEASAQRVFMQLIEREMYKINKEKDLSEQASCIGSRNQRFIQCPELIMTNQGSVSEWQHDKKKDEKTNQSLENSSSNFNELIIKVLNLQEENEYLFQKLLQFSQKSSSLEKENQQLQTLNKSLEESIRLMNIKIGQLSTQLQSFAVEKFTEIEKIQKKWQGKLKIVEKNKEQQIHQLKQINSVAKKSADLKIAEYEQRLSIKREKIAKLYENQQRLQNNLRQQSENVKNLKDQIKYLNQILSKNRQELNSLEMVKDELSMDIQIRNTRLEDMRLLLFSQKSRVPINKQISNVCTNQECSLPSNQFEWSVGSNQWKNSSHASKFQKLNLNPHHVNQVGISSGYSWCKQSMRSKNKKLSIGNSNSDYTRHFQSHISYLNKKIEFLAKQNQSYLKHIKVFRDLKYENSKLLKSLKQHELYRGEENQIITGCLYELRKRCEENYMEFGSECSVKSRNLNFKNNQRLVYSDRNKESSSKNQLNPIQEVLE